MMKQCDILEKMIHLSPDNRERTSKVVARSFFRILAKNGFSHSDIMDFAGNLLDEVMRDMGRNGVDGQKEMQPDFQDAESSREVA